MAKRSTNASKTQSQAKGTSNTRTGVASNSTATTDPSETNTGNPSSQEHDPPPPSVDDENFCQSRTQSNPPASDVNSNQKDTDGMDDNDDTARQELPKDPEVHPESANVNAPDESPPPVYKTGPIPTPIPPEPTLPRVPSPIRPHHSHRASSIDTNARQHRSRNSFVNSRRHSPSRPHTRVPLFSNPSRKADAQTLEFQYLCDQLNRFHYAYNIGTITMEDYTDQHHQIVTRADDLYDDLCDARKTAKDDKKRRLSDASTTSHQSKRSQSEFARAADKSRNKTHQDNIRRKKPGQSSREDQVPANASASAANPTPNRPASAAPSDHSSASGGTAPIVTPWDITPYILTPSNPVEEEYVELFNNLIQLKNFCSTTEKRHLKEIKLKDDYALYQLNAQPEEADTCRLRANTLSSHICEQYIEVLEQLDVLDARSTSTLETLFSQIHDTNLYRALVTLLRHIKSLRKDIAFLNDERRNALLCELGYPPGPIDT
jgi:hypothetical protein